MHDSTTETPDLPTSFGETVQDDGSLLKENENPSPQIIDGTPQNICIFADGSLQSRSGRCLVIHYDIGFQSIYKSHSHL